MMYGDSTLAGRVAVVTGGGRGLGRAFALALAEAGADVALAARSTEDIERVAAEVKARGRRALAVPTDVAETADVERLVERVLGELGDLDILVNNSGVIHSAPLIETPLEEWDRVVATNLRGCFLCMRAAGRHFADRRAGKVINVASNFAFMGVPNYSSYCASKAAVVNLTRAAAIEWAGFGVQVNALAPGYVETDMNAAARGDEEMKARIVRQIPARRMARPEELGPLVVYLASSASDFMTGETLVFDGGQVAK
jgi:NAD(P)-dependent dehydrogenase (short-subunit alcohol dehydrogenase family)